MLELAILGLLKERAMHGYELSKQLSARLGFFWTVSFGSLYPTLRKLEQRGAVERFLPPDAASRRKQVYRITDVGERMLVDLLTGGSSSSWEEEKFPLRLAFFGYLKPDTRIRVLERRKAYLEEKLAEGEASLRRARRDPYTQSLMRHGLSVTAADIAWLDELIGAERAAMDGGRDLAAEAPIEPSGDELAPAAADAPELSAN